MIVLGQFNDMYARQQSKSFLFGQRRIVRQLDRQQFVATFAKHGGKRAETADHSRPALSLRIKLKHPATVRTGDGLHDSLPATGPVCAAVVAATEGKHSSKRVKCILPDPWSARKLYVCASATH